MADPTINDPKNQFFNLDRRCDSLQEHVAIVAGV
jgi:hypothetical protein